MEIIRNIFDGIVLIKPDVFGDERGYFFESFNEDKYKEHLGDVRFVQDNISKSTRGVIRGLHYQIGNAAQGKLCHVLKGRVLDVAVDIRVGSPTFGGYYAAELSEENHHQLWIPPGYAHGFSVLSDDVIFHYKCTALYHKSSERAVRYDDPAIGIKWQVDNPIVSAKDAMAPLLSEIAPDFTFTPGAASGIFTP
ncbi:MAG TPA: dTDP-4-dehydrorhamnose 3,5-epimerase [Bacteroidota bacterium]|nr:dTDP-4-dehydrorhamnose 3,5-epimerase [Bacteroidota bacterium]